MFYLGTSATKNQGGSTFQKEKKKAWAAAKGKGRVAGIRSQTGNGGDHSYKKKAVHLNKKRTSVKTVQACTSPEDREKAITLY